MGKMLIELVSNFYSITGKQEIDTILFGIAALIAFSVAFNLVGYIFDFLGCYDSGLMSDMHWLIRIIVFVLLTWVFKTVFNFINWVFSFSWLVYTIATVFILLFIVLLCFIKYKRTKLNFNVELKSPFNQCNNEQQTEQKSSELDEVNTIIYENSKDYCPRCGSILINRKGPYGMFWGCKSFPECRYTRKFK